jgi:hypothetical protein
MTDDIDHGADVLVTMRRLFLYAMMCLVGASHFAMAETISLPNPAEFRDGDGWEALDTVASHKLGATVHVPFVKKNNTWQQKSMPSMEEMMSQQSKVGQRDFTDLAGAPPNFPTDTSKLFAAPDGKLYLFRDASRSWMNIGIGFQFTVKSGKSIVVRERMTQPEADQMTLALQRLLAESAQTNPAASNGPEARQPGANHDPWYAAHVLHCPNGYSFPPDKASDNWRPQELNMIAACAAVSSLPPSSSGKR